MWLTLLEIIASLAIYPIGTLVIFLGFVAAAFVYWMFPDAPMQAKWYTAAAVWLLGFLWMGAIAHSSKSTKFRKRPTNKN